MSDRSGDPRRPAGRVTARLGNRTPELVTGAAKNCTVCDGTGDNPNPFSMSGGNVVQEDDCTWCDGTGVEPPATD